MRTLTGTAGIAFQTWIMFVPVLASARLWNWSMSVRDSSAIVAIFARTFAGYGSFGWVNARYSTRSCVTPVWDRARTFFRLI